MSVSIGKAQVLAAYAKLPGVTNVFETSKAGEGDVIKLNAHDDAMQFALLPILRPSFDGETVNVFTRRFNHVPPGPATPESVVDTLSNFPGHPTVSLAPLPFNPTSHPVITVRVGSEADAALLKAIVADEISIPDAAGDMKPWDVVYSTLSK